MTPAHAGRPAHDAWLCGELAKALVGTAYARRRTWPLAVVVFRGGERPYAASRGAFAAWLRSHGLETSARECMRRRVRPGEILVWLEVEAADVATAGFTVAALGRLLSESP